MSALSSFPKTVRRNIFRTWNNPDLHFRGADSRFPTWEKKQDKFFSPIKFKRIYNFSNIFRKQFSSIEYFAHHFSLDWGIVQHQLVGRIVFVGLIQQKRANTCRYRMSTKAETYWKIFPLIGCEIFLYVPSPVIVYRLTSDIFIEQIAHLFHFLIRK